MVVSKRKPSPPNTIVPLVIESDELAALLGVARSTLFRLKGEGRLPPPLDLGDTRALRWSRRQVENWVACGCPKPGEGGGSDVHQ